MKVKNTEYPAPRFPGFILAAYKLLIVSTDCSVENVNNEYLGNVVLLQIQRHFTQSTQNHVWNMASA